MSALYFKDVSMTASIVRKATVGLAWTWLTLSDHAIIKTKHMLGILFLITTSSLPCLSFAGDYYFWGQQQPPPEYPRFSTGDEVCQSYNGIVAGGLVYAVWIPLYFGSGDPRTGQLAGGKCDLYRVQDGGGLGYFGVNFVRGDSCKDGGVFNDFSAECESPLEQIHRKNVGKPDSVLACHAPSLFQGDPINAASGNNFQSELDLQLGDKFNFFRYYNSFTGLWTHSYGAYLWINEYSITLVLEDGGQRFFQRANGNIFSEATELGHLSYEGTSWTYISPENEVLTFNTLGQLTSKQLLGQPIQILERIDSLTTVTDINGRVVTFSEDDKHQLQFLKYKNIAISFSFDKLGRMVDLARTVDGKMARRQYHYNVPGKPQLLTGITNEQGIQYVSWRYDDEGRAYYNDLAGGVDNVTISYDADGSSAVTNSLGRRTVYRYKIVQGVKRIVSIEGEPSANCPASGSRYTYSDRGEMLTKTDAKGLITAYTYNDRGLEASRTEATGTPLARTVTTEWDPERFLPTKVVEPGRVTVYSYDSQGRELTRQVTSR